MQTYFTELPAGSLRGAGAQRRGRGQSGGCAVTSQHEGLVSPGKPGLGSAEPARTAALRRCTHQLLDSRANWVTRSTGKSQTSRNTHQMDCVRKSISSKANQVILTVVFYSYAT